MQSLLPSGGQPCCFGERTKLRCRFQLCFLLLLWQVLQFPTSTEALDNGTYLLGFLAPTAGVNIPENLAIEWQSAFQVAVDVLNSNRSYTLLPHVEDSECSPMPAQSGAHVMLQQDGLIGAVGPACSHAAIAAARIFDLEGPAALLSFAATAEPLSDRGYYPTFFRTVYSDKHQAMAMAASFDRLDIVNATLLYTKEFYSSNLAMNINETVGGLSMILLEEGPNNSTVDRDQLRTILDSLQPTDFIILVVQPTAAEEVWDAAYEMGKTDFPWWYFGTDGATVFDPLDVDPNLVNALQGEIGLAPYGGDLSPDSKCNQFYTYWQEMGDKYPGLPALGANKSRSYVPYLFDAVTAFYKVLDSLEAAGLEFTRERVYLAFNESGTGKISFDGCTGLVEFDPETGSRSVAAQPAVYDVVSLTDHSWELKGRIENATFVALEPLDRPGMHPAPGQDYIGQNPKRKVSAGLIAGIVFLVIAIMVLITACFVYYAKKRKSSIFVRIT
ncbi:unnamed protein product [Calypogeia fissa]